MGRLGSEEDWVLRTLAAKILEKYGLSREQNVTLKEVLFDIIQGEYSAKMKNVLSLQGDIVSFPKELLRFWVCLLEQD